MQPHARYAALVARQLAAIQAEDLETFHALADQRDRAAAEIQHIPTRDGDEARQALWEAAELDAEILSLMRRRREHLRAHIRGEEAGRASAAAYARAAAPRTASAFDVSL